MYIAIDKQGMYEDTTVKSFEQQVFGDIQGEVNGMYMYMDKKLL